eukprot:364087-Chlamydomonas_euryale.AAC.6
MRPCGIGNFLAKPGRIHCLDVNAVCLSRCGMVQGCPLRLWSPHALWCCGAGGAVMLRIRIPPAQQCVAVRTLLQVLGVGLLEIANDEYIRAYFKLQVVAYCKPDKPVHDRPGHRQRMQTHA